MNHAEVYHHQERPWNHGINSYSLPCIRDYILISYTKRKKKICLYIYRIRTSNSCLSPIPQRSSRKR